LFNTAEAAAFLRVSEASIRRWSDSGLLVGHRVGGRRERRFTETELARFLNRSPQPPPTPHAEAAINVGGVLVPLPGHLATFHSSDAGALRLALPFLADGLRSGQPCFLVATDAILQRYLDALAEQDGVDLEAAIANQQLTPVRFSGGTVSQALAYWEQSFSRALANGTTVLRVVGDMASVRSMFTSEEEMLKYEEALELMLKRYPGVVLCQYDVREFGGSSMLRALKAHPDLFGVRLGTFLN
jgi:excisionase family DNA binding protein